MFLGVVEIDVKNYDYRDTASEDIYNPLFFSMLKIEHAPCSTINYFFDLSFCLKQNTVSAINTVSSAITSTSQRRQSVSSTKPDTLRQYKAIGIHVRYSLFFFIKFIEDRNMTTAFNENFKNKSSQKPVRWTDGATENQGNLAKLTVAVRNCFAKSV